MNSGSSASIGVGRAVGALVLHQLVPAAVARRLHRHRRAGALHHEHGLHAGRAGTLQRFVDVDLQRHFLAAAQAFVGGDDEFRRRIRDAPGQRIRRESAEHHRVHRADARAGEHRHRGFRNHRHVDGDAIAFRDAETLQHVRRLAHLRMQLAIADRLAIRSDRRLPRGSRSCRRAWPDDGPGNSPTGSARRRSTSGCAGPSRRRRRP